MRLRDLQEALLLAEYGRREMADELTDDEILDIYEARSEADRLRHKLVSQHQRLADPYFELLGLDKVKLMAQLYLGGASYESVGLVFGMPAGTATKLVRRYRAESRMKARKETRAEARDATIKHK